MTGQDENGGSGRGPDEGTEAPLNWPEDDSPAPAEGTGADRALPAPGGPGAPVVVPNADVDEESSSDEAAREESP